MNKYNSCKLIREKLKNNTPSIGGWIQIPHPSIAEIMGQSGYDWVAIDMEHGSISRDQLPDLFRALELGGTLPLVRLGSHSEQECRSALDAGAAGVIIPKIQSAKQLQDLIVRCCWPPAGERGVAFSRANLFGKNFNDYFLESQTPLIIAMIEDKIGLEKIDEILNVKGLDAIFVGPYDLSASLGIIGDFKNPKFINAMNVIKTKAKDYSIPSGVHVVEASKDELENRINEGYKFIAYSIDSVILRCGAKFD
ncbi:HpcH/HpaI aldolase/citrate lyase family protein [Polynucleobacter sp. AP-Ainpum-60-G11]|uniref:HpcH/HpaI aldolase family protein n=1 Tax=Polynucleobacter sp. AP-Ainpum-60-G11 TaxID=2576926 RepID=UPI001BFE3984|nr:aldolase/citrate lyase family protein [Polynucleobacter sp. AP-Ainpum-60-G11]QWE27015.1 2,4-dihydroxyhept-2-ene-1,7-dioic acid aldolase [Polynucleobacter sp. AP-Ainpum-60-G11]